MESPEVTFIFQFGLIRDTVSAEVCSLNLKSIKELACNFINAKIPNHGLTRLLDRLMLFRHDYTYPNVLLIINAVSDIVDETVVEIVLAGKAVIEPAITRPHYLSIKKYKPPTFCDFCGEMLFGLVRQGLKCEGCSLNFHKRCVVKIPNNCSSGYKHRRSSTLHVPHSTSETGSNSSIASDDSNYTSSSFSTKPSSRSPSLTSRTDALSPTSPGAPSSVNIPHTFNLHTYTRPTLCGLCKKLLKGLFKQGLQCKDCGFNVHKKCLDKVPKDCVGEPVTNNKSNNYSGDYADSGVGDTSRDILEEDSSDNEALSPTDNKMAADSNNKMANGSSHSHTTGHSPHGTANIPFIEIKSNTEEEDEDEERGSTDGGGPSPRSEPRTATATPSNNIPLMRVVQSIKHTKRRGSKVIKEGWMIHYTSKDSMVRAPFLWPSHLGFCIQYKKSLSSSFSTKPSSRSPSLTSRTDALSPTSPGAPSSVNIPHTFNLHTYTRPTLCGLCKKLLKGLFKQGLQCKDCGFNVHKKCLDKVPKDCVGEPVTNNKSNNYCSTSHCFILKTNNLDYYVGEDTHSPSDGVETPVTAPESGLGARAWELSLRQALMPVQEPSGTKCEDVSESEESRVTDMSQLYQISPDEVLGSGQFGIVYGGVHRKSGRGVAIKVIDKLRFPTKQEAQLKNEVAILQNLCHPGVVNLERMFETPGRIFVVMEKLQGDMLEMILSSEKGRLSERTTKFIITQILVALKHLHSKNIVHCDLKPENVLLSTNSELPQVKLCDFGFARIIGEKSFRRSVVGTPAYLAPEVLRNKGYNRSLDMWSVGVIVYVSLSGTFPFNEDEDINEQIQNAAFMYPPRPWRDISSDAIDLINNLLQVKQRKRLSVDKSLAHPWLQDPATWSDLRGLERQIGVRYLTHPSDDARWASYAASSPSYEMTSRML
ncbi:serine/threonine-protein kinase D3 [Diaphorina citri]|uniref:protein kinase C n=1 Tax=Diaphorina citri TaxID=121845 RepID=A0A3Q0ISV2_DIACI|nr:serine/threonine-protein kinase D3 [Diaphorina citri]